MVEKATRDEFYLEALREIDTHIRSTSDPVSYIIETLKRSLPEYQDESMDRILELRKQASMMKLAEHVLYIGKKEGLAITASLIQKVMFFALGFHVRDAGGIDALARETYDYAFERWTYGPTVPRIYFLHKGSVKPIEDSGVYHSIYAVWDDRIVKLLKTEVNDLIAVSRDLESWREYKDAVMNKRYTPIYRLEEIERDFLCLS